MPNWEEIQREWETSEITFKGLAEKHGLKDSTIRSRKNRELWQRNDTVQRATKKSSVATEKGEDVAGKKKKSTSNGKKKRSGNPNPKNQFSHRNNPKLLHGLRSKFLHADQIEIIEAMEGSSHIDQLWMQIEIKFSSIIRMQKIMWVDDEHDHLKEESGYSSGAEGSSVTYKIVYAHERYESYIKAQTRAMSEYRNLIKQYIELTDEFDERHLKLEQMQLNIDKTKVEVEKINKTEDKGPLKIIVDYGDES